VVSDEIEIASQTGTLREAQLVVFKPGAEIVSTSRGGGAHVMLVGREPFPKSRHIHWNLLSSSKDRIEQAKDDWRHRRFVTIAGETEFIPQLPDRLRHSAHSFSHSKRVRAFPRSPSRLRDHEPYEPERLE
jgi:hypothetical protein